MVSNTTYVIISPVKDEERYILATLQAVLNQTIKPLLWIVVDDGSRDNTLAILSSHIIGHEWIRIVRVERDSKRQPGSAVINAFNIGLRSISDILYDIVVKLDCDVDFDSGYFQALIEKFEEDDRLGIASGLCTEKKGVAWYPSSGPPYHAVGACKMVRRKCFEVIGGFIPARGWDTVDEIRAQMAGWRTCHFTDVPFRHLKPEGSGIGFVRTSAMHGEIYYLTGGGVAFLLLKVVKRIFIGKPLLIGGVVVLWGFLQAWGTGRRRLVNDAEARFYRALLNKQVALSLGGLLGLRGAKNEARSTN